MYSKYFQLLRSFPFSDIQDLSNFPKVSRMKIPQKTWSYVIKLLDGFEIITKIALDRSRIRSKGLEQRYKKPKSSATSSLSPFFPHREVWHKVLLWFWHISPWKNTRIALQKRKGRFHTILFFCSGLKEEADSWLWVIF